MRRIAFFILLLAAALPAAASAHRPGTDGGGGEKACGLLTGVSEFGRVGVGATNMRCIRARRVARRAVGGQAVEGWRCTGGGTRFGHCHGLGARRGKTAHWFAPH